MKIFLFIIWRCLICLCLLQRWRLLHNFESMLFKVFHGKYFPHITFLELQLWCKPSYAWRSIYVKNNILTRESLWWVKSWESINIWKDRWIQKFWSRIEPSSQILTLDYFVNEFLDPSSRTWNEDFLRYTFAQYTFTVNL